MGHTRNRTDTNVLIDEIIGREVNECIVGLDWILISSFTKLSQLTNCDGLHSLKYFDEIVGLLLQTRVVSERVELAVDSSGPTGHLIIHNVDLLEFLLELIVITSLPCDCLLHLQYVLVLELGITFLSGCCVGLRVDLEVMEPVSEHLVVFLQDVDLLVTVVNILKQVGVGLLTGQEFLHKLLDVSYSSGRLDILESGVNLSRIRHLLLHLLPHESVPQLLDVEVLPVLDLGLILAVVGSLIGDLLVLLDTLHAFLN